MKKTINQISTFVQDVMARNNIPSLALAVVDEKGSTLLQQGYGLASMEGKIKASAQTLYSIASLAKLFTATIVMMLVEKEKISLHSSLRDFIPKHIPPTWDRVQVFHLLTHTSGISFIGEKFHLDFKPGTHWAYSNSGYQLLGLLVEAIAGSSYKKFLQKHVLDFLGMQDTFLGGAPLNSLAQGYKLGEDGVPVPLDKVSLNQNYAAGAIVSTVQDIVRWYVALRKGALISERILDEMWASPYVTIDDPTYPYPDQKMGLGWFILPEERLGGHAGGTKGFSSDTLCSLDSSFMCVALCNLDNVYLYKILTRPLLRMLF